MQVKNLGRVVQGHVLDMDKHYLQGILQRYDEQLYLKWNPKKRQGYGMWEVRRRPTKKSLVFRGYGENGETIFSLEYVENDMVHHVLDAEYLDLRIPVKLLEMDTFKLDGNYNDIMEYRAAKREEELEARRTADIRYMVKENKKYYSQLRELVALGYNPAWFYSSHRKVK